MKMANVLARRAIFPSFTTHEFDKKNKTKSKAEHLAMLAAIVNRCKLFPESVVFGTGTMKFNVTEIEFDFDDECYGYDPLTFDEEISIRDQALGVWEADDEEDLIEEVTTASGWCIKSIDYEIQLK